MMVNEVEKTTITNNVLLAPQIEYLQQVARVSRTIQPAKSVMLYVQLSVRELTSIAIWSLLAAVELCITRNLTTRCYNTAENASKSCVNCVHTCRIPDMATQSSFHGVAYSALPEGKKSLMMYCCELMPGSEPKKCFNWSRMCTMFRVEVA
jgi:hypothetical protein